MMNFSDISMQLSQSPLIHFSLKMLEELEDDVFFSIGCSKDQIYRAKHLLFQNKIISKIHVISDNTNFGCISPKILGKKINIIFAERIKSTSNDDLLIDSLKDSLVITTSNIVAKIGFARMYAIAERLPSTIFVVHDYDNHHMINNNIQIAIFADVYAPAHQSDNLMASRVNPNTLGGIPCGSNQWSMEFILNFGKKNLPIERSETPLGKYFFYEKFIHRNKTVNTLSQSYPNIGFVKQDFHALTQENKWREWSCHELHFVVPVLNDLPIRFFDALITGGIPLIPSGLRPFVESLQIPERFYAIYGPLDILEPKKLLSMQSARFKSLGEAGILERHNFALENFHIDVILGKLITESRQLYEGGRAFAPA
jgi:hypothetical protein